MISHIGEGLAILTPHWMEFALNDDTAYKFADYARNVWDVVNDDDMAAAKEGLHIRESTLRRWDFHRR